MTPEEGSRLVLSFARALYVNGQATDETIEAAERLARSVGLPAPILPRLGGLPLQGVDADPSLAFRVTEADPSGVNMTRVASATQAIEDVESGTLPVPRAAETIAAIAQLPPAPTWLFVVAAGVGAVALAVIF